MSDIGNRIARLSPEKRALLVRRLESEAVADRSQWTNALAIIGIGCRFPGRANSPQAFWDMLCKGIDAIGEVPRERWDVDGLYDPDCLVPGKMATRWGGFIDDIDLFDPEFFDVTPREAVRMDPQQRMMLETAWEAIEDAGLTAGRLAGSPTGVFVGVHSQSSDYYSLQLGNPEAIDAYTSTGGAHSILANRLSYWLDLRGPSLAVDTACSSSLVAVHLAVQSLRSGECDLALAGGVNLMLTPEATIAFSKLQMMAADGRCKTFDARADGFVRGEGCGLIVLKRLSDALRDGDPIRALIRGSAINQDGHTNGLTAPNGPSQQQVLRRALANAGVQPEQIGYVETHGTGTALGDPIEVEALTAVLGRPRGTGEVCALGSVKTNIGHLEAAAGIAGLIKVVLCLQHRYIPPHLHFTRLNPHISLDNTPFVIPVDGMPWPGGERRRFAGVSSFGFGGTNAHVVLEEAPEVSMRSAGGEDGVWLLPVSARSAGALEALAGAYAQRLEAGSEVVGDVCYSASCRRTHHERRLAAVGTSGRELAERLRAYARGEAAVGVAAGARPAEGEPGLALVFSGQGSQRAGMGRELLACEPVFRAAVERIDALFEPLSGWSLRAALAAGEADRLQETTVAQPALFALQLGLAELLASWGAEPQAVVGHSVGEVAAACVAGALSLEEAVRVVYHRGRLMQGAHGGGRMAAVELDEAEARALLAPYGERLAVAAVNAPRSLTLSGEGQALAEVVAELEGQGRFCRLLAVEYAFHSAQMAPAAEALVEALTGLARREPRCALYSTVRGGLARSGDYGAAYWGRNVREAVRFGPAVEAMAAAGVRWFVELSPQPVLGHAVMQVLAERREETLVVPTLRPGRGEAQALREALGALYAGGGSVDWARLYPQGGRCVGLPAYPWQRKRYWLKVGVGDRLTVAWGGSRGRDTAMNTLLGQRVRSPGISGIVFESRLGVDTLPFLHDHRIYGALLLPAPVLVEMALAAAREAFGSEWRVFKDLCIHRALVLSDQDRHPVQVILERAGADAITFRILALDRPDDPDSTAWTLHATGTLRQRALGREPDGPLPAYLAANQGKEWCREEISGDEFYREFNRRGLALGPLFQGVDWVRRRDGEAFARIRLPEALASEARHYHIHPVLLDACFQIVSALRTGAGAQGGFFPFVGLDGFDLNGHPGEVLYCHAKCDIGLAGDPEGFSGLARLYNEDGWHIGEARGVRFRRASRQALLGRTDPRSVLFDLLWCPRTQLDRASRRCAPDLPGPAQLAEQLLGNVATAANGGSDPAAELLPQFDRLSVDFITSALRQLGWDMAPGGRVTVEALAQRLGVAEQHCRLFGRALEILGENGLLNQEGSHWQVVRRPETTDPAGQCAALLRAHPEFAAELTLFERCGERLADVLRAECDPLQLLFPEGSLATAEKFYQESSFSRLSNALIQQAMSLVARALPERRVIRILEIGAGTGGTTTHVLPVLPANRTDYVFSDVSNLFLERARKKFCDYPFLRYELLDIEHDPEMQGFAPQQFDLVLAINVLHATADLRRTLRHVLSMLVPNGLLVLVEGVQPARWIDLIFGLTEGWWKFADHDLRPSHPLLSWRKWLSMLQELGFAEAVAVPVQTAESGGLFQQSVILARAPRAADAAPPAIDADASAKAETSHPRRVSRDRRWLILADQGGVGRHLAAAIRAREDDAVLVYPGKAYESLSEHRRRIDPSHPGDFRRLINEMLTVESGTPCAAVIDLWSTDAASADDSPDALEKVIGEGCTRVLYLVKALIGAEHARPPRLWLVTRGAQAVSAGDAVQLAQAPLWGMGRVVAREHPEFWGGLLDIDPETAASDAALDLLDQISDSDGEDQMAFRAGDRYVVRLMPRPVASEHDIGWGADSVYLITGGLGDLGLWTARWMVEQGARRLMLLARTALPPRAEWDRVEPGSSAGRRIAAIRQLESQGAEIRIAAVDVADGEQLRAFLMQAHQDGWAPVRGVVHTAAVIEDRLLSQLDPAGLLPVLRPKVVGGWLLHRLLEDEQLDFFVLFSSLGALVGLPGQAGYAAANAFLDALAHYRCANGRPALSVNWCVWSRSGLALTPGGERTIRDLAARGVESLPPELAVDALGLLMRQQAVQSVVLPLDWKRFRAARASTAGSEAPLLARLNAPQDERPPQPRQAGEARPRSVREDLLAFDPGPQRRRLLESHLVGLVAGVLRLDPTVIDAEKPLGAMGVDSLMAFELKKRCEESLGLTLSATVAWNHPTITALATHLAQKLDIPLDPPAPAGDTTQRMDREEAGRARTRSSSSAARLEQVGQLTDEEALRALLGQGGDTE